MKTDILLKGAIGLYPRAAGSPSSGRRFGLHVPYSPSHGPFAGSGTPIANGMHDYLTMLNERDGGIGGVKLIVDECETTTTLRRASNAMMPIQTEKPGHYQSVVDRHRCPADDLQGLGLQADRSCRWPTASSASAKGDVFLDAILPATYWDGASEEILEYAGGGSIDALKGKTIGYLYFDAAFGREALPFFQSLAKEVGFNLQLYPVKPADMQNQSSKWLDIRRR